MTQSSGMLVAIALWTAVGVFLLTLSLFAVIVAIRAQHSRRLAEREELHSRWREVFTRAIVERPDSSPALSRREANEVLGQWVYYLEFLKGECQENLAQLARLAGLDLHAKRFLKAGNTRRRLLAIQALGSLRDREYRRVLWPLARSENPYESIAAAHALMRIAPRETIDEMVKMVATRPDWPPARVMAILREAGTDVVSEPLARTLLAADEAYKPLLVVYLETAHEEVALDTIRKVLPATQDQQVIATCLYQLREIVHPGSLEILRQFLAHPNWILQLHAVTGVGRLGNEEDIPDLLRMLQHQKYWVRYRAAQALAKLPTVTGMRLRQIEQDQTDRYARDILRQVISERVA